MYQRSATSVAILGQQTLRLSYAHVQHRCSRLRRGRPDSTSVKTIDPLHVPLAPSLPSPKFASPALALRKGMRHFGFAQLVHFRFALTSRVNRISVIRHYCCSRAPPAPSCSEPPPVTPRSLFRQIGACTISLSKVRAPAGGRVWQVVYPLAARHTSCCAIDSPRLIEGREDPACCGPHLTRPWQARLEQDLGRWDPGAVDGSKPRVKSTTSASRHAGGRRCDRAK